MGAGHRTQASRCGHSRHLASWAYRDTVFKNVTSGTRVGTDCYSDTSLYQAVLVTNTHMFAATVHNGMTRQVAATLIADRITGVDNECAHVFSPHRFSVKSLAKNFADDGIPSAIGLLSQAFYFPSKELESLKNGTGGTVEYKGKKVGAYKSEKGEIFLVSTRCPHLGCELQWNPDEKSWDCPCHGSRFDVYGKWLSSPSVTDLPHRKNNSKYN